MTLTIQQESLIRALVPSFPAYTSFSLLPMSAKSMTVSGMDLDLPMMNRPRGGWMRRSLLLTPDGKPS